jgi:hypothetical protein
MKRLTRRELAGVAGAALAINGIARETLAQTAEPPANVDWYRQARESKRASAEELARFDLPMATEPAFHFKA